MDPFPPGPLASQMNPNLIKWTQMDAEWRPRGPFLSVYSFFQSRLKKGSQMLVIISSEAVTGGSELVNVSNNK